MSETLSDCQKQMLNEMARSVMDKYDFSLLKSDKNYRDIFEAADLLGGAVHLSYCEPTTVSRCGNGFLINIPKDGDDGYKLRCFAMGLAILYFIMDYGDEPGKFKTIKNLNPVTCDVRNMKYITYLVCCFICSRSRLAKAMMKYRDEKSMTDLKQVAKELGLDEGTVQYVGRKYGLIRTW